MQNSTANRAQIIIPSTLGSRTASDTFDLLEEMLALKSRKIQINCEQIETLSSGHVELISRLHRYCDSKKVAIAFIEPSSELLFTLHMLGFDVMGIDSKVAEEFNDSNKIIIPESHYAPYDDQIELKLGEVDKAVKRFIAYLNPIGIPKVQLYVLRTLVFETATNISLHSQLTQDDTLLFRAILDNSQVTLSFCDKGIYFDPTAYRQSSNAMTAARYGVWQGYGISMIKKLSDTVQYQRTENLENELVLTIQWRNE